MIRARAPLVSVVIPTFNFPKGLFRAAQSVLTQEYPNIEIIIVNDAGECVRDVVDSLESDRVKYIVHPTNLNVSAARNTGVQHSEGEYLCFLDDDDLLYSSHIALLVNCLEGDPTIGGAYTDAYDAILEGPKTDLKFTMRVPKIGVRDWSPNAFREGNFVGIMSVMIRRCCFEYVGGFDPRLELFEDWDLWIRVEKHFQFKRLPYLTCECTNVQGGRTPERQERLRKHLETSKQVFLEVHGINLDGVWVGD